MSYDFFADRNDKIEILDFIFHETDLQIFDHYSSNGAEIKEYKSTQEIISNIDLENGGQFEVRFQLWSPAFKGDLVFRKMNLNPEYFNGHTIRYETSGWGLIQLYFGGIEDNILHYSHIGHQSEKWALAYSNIVKDAGPVEKWDWKEVERQSHKLRYQIHNKMSVRTHASWGVLPGADKLAEQGIRLSIHHD